MGMATQQVTTRRAGRARIGLILPLSVALIGTGCGPERAHSTAGMTQGTASYQVTADGVTVAGSFTLVVGFPDRDLETGDESEVYLHRLQLLEGYAVEVDEWSPAIEMVTSDQPMPFVATVGDQTRATYHWSIDMAPTLPSALCDARLVSQVYLSLTDELLDLFMDPDGHWQQDHLLVWSPDPCDP